MNYFENLGKDKARPRGYVLGPSGTGSLRERFDLTYMGSFDAYENRCFPLSMPT